MRARIVLAAVAATLVAAPQAQATSNFIDFGVRCTPGTIKSCFSIQLFTSAFGTGTNVVLRIRNEQGFFGDNGGASVLERIGLLAPNITGASGLTVTAGGGATTTGTPSSYWSLAAPGWAGSGPIELSAALLFGTVQGGVTGCTAYGGLTSYFQTCGTGYVDFAFFTNDAWTADQGDVAWIARNQYGEVVHCGNVAAPANRLDECPVVPEPVTMVLLGTGLAGIGGAGLARRRKQNGDITNG